jgi:hypothetical protein
VSDERRKYGRLTQAVDGSWRGASGQTRCRIGDLGVGGCFVQSQAMPQKDEATVVSVELGGQTLALPGTVVYVEPGMGFAVQFTALSSNDLAKLKELIAGDAGAANVG